MLGQLSLFDTTQEQELIKPTVQTEYGQLWQLGKHRLLVGNSRSREDVLRLFDGAKADLCFTSPPYDQQRLYDGVPFNWTDLMCETFQNTLAVAKPDIHILINLGMSHKNRRVDFYWNDWLDYCERAGWSLFAMNVWDKGAAMPGDMSGLGRLGASFEFIFHFTQNPERPNKWIKTLGRTDSGGGFRKLDGIVKPYTNPENIGQEYKIPDNVIRINREMRRETWIKDVSHPAVFPIELPQFIYKTYSQPGDIVFEPFSGSGTSIIAGESLGRIVYAIDKVPEYCAIAIERWQRATKQKAVLLENK